VRERDGGAARAEGKQDGVADAEGAGDLRRPPGGQARLPQRRRVAAAVHQRDGSAQSQVAGVRDVVGGAVDREGGRGEAVLQGLQGEARTMSRLGAEEGRPAVQAEQCAEPGTAGHGKSPKQRRSAIQSAPGGEAPSISWASSAGGGPSASNGADSTR